MKLKRINKTLWLLLAVLLIILTATLFLAIHLDRSPQMQKLLPGAPLPLEMSQSMDSVLEMMHNDDLHQAELLLENMLHNQPANSDTWHLLGSVYFRQEKFEKAQQTFIHLIRLQPENAAAYNNLGKVLEALKKFDDSAEAFSMAVKLAPDNPEILLNTASLHARMHNDRQALLFLRSAMNKGATPEVISHYTELVQLLERPDFMSFYQQQTSVKQQK